jgi:glycosyltransferase involved in cell wall biosynthesis
MNILFVEPFGHREGHPSFESRRMSHALVNAGAKVTLLTFLGLQGDWARKSEKVGHVSVFRGRGFVLRSYHILNRYPLIRSVLRIVETFATLLRALWMNRSRRYDVVFVFDAEPVFFICLGLAVLCKGRSFVVTVYNPPPLRERWRSRTGGPLGFLRPLILLDLLRHLIRIAIASRPATSFRIALYGRALQRNRILFVCHTEEMAQAYASYMDGVFRDRFVCIPLGVEKAVPRLSREDARRRLGLPLTRTVLLSFGNNHPGKDLEVVFQALGSLPPEFLLLQVGKLGARDMMSDPRWLAARYDCVQRTIVEDRLVPEEEARLYFFAADAVILSYRKHFTQSASIINDAAKYSAPVIASGVGQLGEFVERYGLGLTFVPECHDSLCRAILSFQRLTADEKKRMRANFRAYAADYPWTENANKHLNVFRSVMEPPQQQRLSCRPVR